MQEAQARGRSRAERRHRAVAWTSSVPCAAAVAVSRCWKPFPLPAGTEAGVLQRQGLYGQRLAGSSGCCCRIEFFYTQTKRSSGSLTAETFGCRQTCCSPAALGKSTARLCSKAWKGRLLFCRLLFPGACRGDRQRAAVSLPPPCAAAPCSPGHRASKGHSLARLWHVPVDGKDVTCPVCGCGLEGATARLGE